MTYTPLPTIPGYTWRSLNPADVHALIRFELACSRLDGATNLASEAEWAKGWTLPLVQTQSGIWSPSAR